MSNLSVLKQNVCNSLWCGNEDIENEGQRIFLEYCEKDVPPFYKAEEVARTWMQLQHLLRIANPLYPNAPHSEISKFFEARLPEFSKHLT